jgi:uncharacterized protein YndB with AHSA1/START domain
MIDIYHRIGAVSASTKTTYDALTTIEGLARWWTADTSGDASSLGGKIAFRFPPGGFDMEVTELVPGEFVRWRVVDGPPEWVDTHIDFTLSRSEDYTIVNFAHRGWAEPVEFLSHCSTKWAQYLLSLKRCVETGTGTPSPDDLQISDWH